MCKAFKARSFGEERKDYFGDGQPGIPVNIKLKYRFVRGQHLRRKPIIAKYKSTSEKFVLRSKN